MKKDDLSSRLDSFFATLLEQADPPTMPAEDQIPDDGPKVGFVDKLRLFDSGVRWMMVKAKVDPEEVEDEFARARNNLTGRSRGRGSSGAARNGSGS